MNLPFQNLSFVFTDILTASHHDRGSSRMSEVGGGRGDLVAAVAVKGWLPLVDVDGFSVFPWAHFILSVEHLHIMK